MVDEWTPAEVFPPGEFLKDELEERGWSQAEFAEIIGRPAAAVSEIIKGKRAITPDTAKAIAAALGTSAMFWMNLDAAYQLYRTEPAPKRIRIEASLRATFPVRPLIARGWIEASSNSEVLKAEVLRFFNVDSEDEKPHFQLAARIATPEALGDAELSMTQLAWLFRVKQIADQTVVRPFSATRLRDALPELRALMGEPEEIRHVPGILEDCGVKFVVVEPLPSSKIDGACFWPNGAGNPPVIGMSLRLDRIDNFWFVLRHEIEHALRGDGRVDEQVVPIFRDVPAQELAANEAAADFCVERNELEDFIARVKPLFSEHRVLAFARRLGIHPGIVVGQLQYRLQRFDWLRMHLVKIRQFVTASAVTDGFGHVFRSWDEAGEKGMSNG